MIFIVVALVVEERVDEIEVIMCWLNQYASVISASTTYKSS